MRSSSAQRIVSFKITDSMYERLEKHAAMMNVSVAVCIVELLGELLDNVETYYKMLAIDEEMEKISFASND